MRTYLIIGCIAAIIQIALVLSAIHKMSKNGRYYTTRGYNELIGGVLIAWFLWPLWIAYVTIVCCLYFFKPNTFNELEHDIVEDMTEKES